MMVGSRRLKEEPRSEKGDLVQKFDLSCGHEEYFIQYNFGGTSMALTEMPVVGDGPSECLYGCRKPKITKSQTVRGWRD